MKRGILGTQKVKLGKSFRELQREVVEQHMNDWQRRWGKPHWDKQDADNQDKPTIKTNDTIVLNSDSEEEQTFLCEDNVLPSMEMETIEGLMLLGAITGQSKQSNKRTRILIPDGPLGLSITDKNDRVIVKKVYDHSVYKGHISVDDVIVSVAGEPVSSIGQFQSVLRKTPRGDHATSPVYLVIEKSTQSLH